MDENWQTKGQKIALKGKTATSIKMMNTDSEGKGLVTENQRLKARREDFELCQVDRGPCIHLCR